MDDRRTAIDVIRETAEDVGADFMFEIPGLLLEEGDVDACVIKRPNDDETEPDGWKHVFVVFNRQHATIQLLDFFDVPEKAQAFFCSYTSVLTRLSKISATHRSH